MYLKGVHMTEGRFFPLEYIRKVLEIGESIDVTMDTPVGDIVARFDDRVSYSAMHRECYERCGDSHRVLANWQADYFGGWADPADEENKKRWDADKLVLQSYGRPYQDGRPAGTTFYEFAKREVVTEFGRTSLG